MNIKILSSYTKQYWMPEDSVFIPIHVGREGKADIGYTGDHYQGIISPQKCKLLRVEQASIGLGKP